MPKIPGSEALLAQANRIAPAIKSLAVPIRSLRSDPDNARLHPERNLEAIKASLRLYGQVKPVVVRRSTGIVMAGNGILMAARSLGWTDLAASVVDMTDVEAAGYGLADNRTAELSSWDFEVVSRLNKLQEEAGRPAVGWTTEELMLQRANLEECLPIQSGDGGQSWQDLWVGMPEFVQDDLTGARSVVVHFRAEEDFLDFLKIVGQTPGDVRQNSIWHPQAEIGRYADKRYVAPNAGWPADKLENAQ
jgi:hypothetical protein